MKTIIRLRGKAREKERRESIETFITNQTERKADSKSQNRNSRKPRPAE